MAAILVTLLVALVGGAFSGVIAALITLSHDDRRERQRQKLEVLHELVANRHYLQGEPFTQALNAVSTAYFDSPEVLSALTDFHDCVTRRDGTAIVNDKLVVLWRAMCTSAGIDQSRLTDSFFLQPFNIRAGASQ